MKIKEEAEIELFVTFSVTFEKMFIGETIIKMVFAIYPFIFLILNWILFRGRFIMILL